LETLNIEQIYLIDPYELYETYLEGKSHYGLDQAPLDLMELRAREKLIRYEKKLTWIKELSSDAAPLVNELVDFVYIDGNHSEEFILEDIKNFYPLLNDRGVIGGHDFYNGFQREHNGVVNAVVDFASKVGHQLRVELPDWWIEK